MALSDISRKQQLHKESLLNQSELKRQLHYDPDTGNFTRLISISPRVKIGDLAGCQHIKRLYVDVRVNSILYPAHRLAFLYMTGAWPVDQIDHINHTRGDNRWCNLVEATNNESLKNKSLYKNNISGINGVNYRKSFEKWRAYIRIDGAIKHLGYFVNIFDAACARKSAEIKHGFHENHGKKS